jgi:DNA-binding MarR family transcriptional regulator
MEIHNSPFLQMFYFIKSMKISGLFSEDISFAEYVMLQLITEMSNETGNTDVWVSDIVKRVEVTPQAVSKFINLAAGKGYIKRFENESDRRSTGVRITDHGRVVLSKAEEELTAFRKSVLKEFSEEELSTMYGLMSKLQKAVQINYAKYKKKSIINSQYG